MVDARGTLFTKVLCRLCRPKVTSLANLDQGTTSDRSGQRRIISSALSKGALLETDSSYKSLHNALRELEENALHGCRSCYVFLRTRDVGDDQNSLLGKAFLSAARSCTQPEYTEDTPPYEAFSAEESGGFLFFATKRLFEKLAQLPDPLNTWIRVTFLEISGSDVRDALSNGLKCDIAEPSAEESATLVRGASEWVVNSYESFVQLMQRNYWQRRSIKEAKIIRPPPSHQVIVMTIEVTESEHPRTVHRGEMVFCELNPLDCSTACEVSWKHFLENVNDEARFSKICKEDAGAASHKKMRFFNRNARTAVVGALLETEIEKCTGECMLRLLRTLEGVPNTPKRLVLRRSIEDELSYEEAYVDVVRKFMPCAASPRPGYGAQAVQSARVERLRLMRKEMQDMGGPTFIPFPFDLQEYAACRQKSPSLFPQLPASGLTPHVVDVVQRCELLKVLEDGQLEAFLLLLLNETLRTLPSVAGVGLPSAGRCCVCSLPLPCKVVSHLAKNEEALAQQGDGDCKSTTVGGLRTGEKSKDSSLRMYFRDCLQGNTLDVLKSLGLRIPWISQPMPRPSTGARQPIIPPRVDARAVTSKNTPCSSHSSVFKRDDATLSSCNDSRTECTSAGQGALREKDTKGSSAHLVRTSACSPTEKCMVSYSEQPSFKVQRSRKPYHMSLLEPLQLKTPQKQAVDGHTQRRLEEDSVRIGYYPEACLPERYKREKEGSTVLLQSFSAKQRGKELEAAQVAKLLAIEAYRERRLTARLKQLDEMKQREILHQSHLEEKERRREKRSKYLHKQLEQYYEQNGPSQDKPHRKNAGVTTARAAGRSSRLKEAFIMSDDNQDDWTSKGMASPEKRHTHVVSLVCANEPYCHVDGKNSCCAGVASSNNDASGYPVVHEALCRVDGTGIQSGNTTKGSHMLPDAFQPQPSKPREASSFRGDISTLQLFATRNMEPVKVHLAGARTHLTPTHENGEEDVHGLRNPQQSVRGSFMASGAAVFPHKQMSTPLRISPCFSFPSSLPRRGQENSETNSALSRLRRRE